MKQKNSSPLQLITKYARPFWFQLLVLIALFGVTTLLVSLKPLIMAPMVNVALGEDILNPAASEEPPTLSELDLNNVDSFVAYYLNLNELSIWNVVLLLSGLYLGATVLEGITEFLSFLLTVRIRVYAFRKMQSDLFDYLLQQSLDFFNQQRTGEIISRLENDTRGTINGLAETIRTLIVSSLMILIYGFLLVSTNLRLTLLVASTAVVQWLIARSLRNFVQRTVRDEFDIIAEANAYLQESFLNIRVIKSFATELLEHVRYSQLIKRMVPIHFRRAISRHINEPISTVIRGLTNVVILLLAMSELLQGNLTTEGFFLFLYLGSQIIPPIAQLGQNYITIQSMLASAERLVALFKLEPLVNSGPIKAEEFEKSISFDKVDFAFTEVPVLTDINLEFKHGEVTALVGHSGAGKSTLTDLVMRFYDPISGQIRIDGEDLRQLDIVSYRRLFGVVAQENLLFNTSIANNIAYANPEIGHRSIMEAAKIANALEFIEDMPDGFETVVGDRGVRISGGQRQRIAIARAIVHRPQILILDEATSSLDTESERLVQAAIDEVIQNTTAVVIAHRLSTVIHADKIVVLDRGRILDQGKHDVLLKRCELYKNLCELQFQYSDTPIATATST